MLFLRNVGGKAAFNDAWSKRMNALDSVKQTEIAKKYYGGKKPWEK